MNVLHICAGIDGFGLALRVTPASVAVNDPDAPAGPQLLLLGVTFVLLSALNATTFSFLSGAAGSLGRNCRPVPVITSCPAVSQSSWLPPMA